VIFPAADQARRKPLFRWKASFSAANLPWRDRSDNTCSDILPFEILLFDMRSLDIHAFAIQSSGAKDPTRHGTSLIARAAPHSPPIPAAAMTLPHKADSVLIRSAMASGVLPTGS
jgi:hypothetical protein